MMQVLKHARHKLSSLNPWTLTFLLLLVLYVLPIWIFKYFPSQDGPCHIYNSFILKHYNDPGYVFNEFYGIRKEPVPNWTSHAVMMLLMYLVPPLIAEKLLLTGYIVLMAGGMLYLLNVVERGRTPLAFLAFPFIYSHLLLMGFYNFSLSIALIMPVVGYWWKHFDTFSAKNMIVLSLLLVVTYFCHLVGLALALFSIAAAAVLSLLPGFKRWKQALLSLLSMLPAVGLIMYYLQTRGTGRGGSWELGRLWQYFIRNEALAYYSESQLIIAKFVTGAFVILFLYTLIREHLFTKEWRLGLRLRRKDFFLFLSAAFFVIYLIAPDDMSGGGGMKERLSFLPFLIIIPWFIWDMPKIARGIVGGLLIVLATAYLTHASYYHKILSDQVEIYTSGFDVVEKNKVIMPLTFDTRAGTWRIGVVHHTAGHYGYARGSMDLDNYEAWYTDYFPTFFKPGVPRPSIDDMIEGRTGGMNVDYIITWNLVSGNDMEVRLLECYEQVKQNGDMRIFRRKIPDAKPEQWHNTK